MSLGNRLELSSSKRQINPEVNIPKGFYYDIQTNDPTTRISLHPNTTIIGYTSDVFDKDTVTTAKDAVYKTGSSDIIPVWESFTKNKVYPLYPTKRFSEKEGDEPKPIKWFHPEDEKDQWVISRGSWVGKESNKDDEPGEYPYAKEAICSAILNEDFRVSISNNFSKLGGDPLGDFINQAKSSLPIMENISEFLRSISKKTGETAEQWKKEGKETKRITTLGKYLNAAAGWTNMNKALLNRAIVFQGARFSYYGGTGVAFDNVALNYTIFPYWDTEDLDDNGFPKFKTVYDQLEVILPYVIGDFVPLTFAEVVKTGKESKAVTFMKMAEATAKDVASSFGSWQLPPGGFEAVSKDIDLVQKGTLKLKIGSLYSIENIIISSCNFSLSKHLIKHPQIEAKFPDPYRNAAQFMTPAFCDVQLGLKPVSMASKNSLLRFMRGEGNVSDKLSVYNTRNNNLDSLEQNLSNLFKKRFGGESALTQGQIKDLQENEGLKPYLNPSTAAEEGSTGSLANQGYWTDNIEYPDDYV